ncbi:MAG: hypothetical protein ACERKN_03385 [Velocimicrobium sp.]
MDDVRIKQVEALTEVYHYNKKLLEEIPLLVNALSDTTKEGILSYLNAFLEGLNWEIEITNRCMDYINQDKVRINGKQVRNTMELLSGSVLAKDYVGVAEILQNGVEAYLEDMGKIVKELI